MFKWTLNNFFLLLLFLFYYYHFFWGERSLDEITFHKYDKFYYSTLSQHMLTGWGSKKEKYPYPQL